MRVLEAQLESLLTAIHRHAARKLGYGSWEVLAPDDRNNVKSIVEEVIRIWAVKSAATNTGITPRSRFQKLVAAYCDMRQDIRDSLDLTEENWKSF